MPEANGDAEVAADVTRRRAERLAKLEGARMTALGTETVWLAVSDDGEGVSVETRAGEAKTKTSGELAAVAGVAPDAKGLTITGEGVVAFEPPLVLGEKFSFSCWFQTPVPEPAAQLAVLASGSQPRQTPQGMQMVVGGICFTKDAIGVMIMGQFDACDCKLDMLKVSGARHASHCWSSV
jgi:hypothetical protein